MTPSKLSKFCSAAPYFSGGLIRACELFSIDTLLRQAHFLAQLAHESNGFTALTENLMYSEQGLLQTFKARVTPQQAREMARKPERIANHVYGSRLGNHAPGDGWRYRGRGLIQLTGRDNYEACTRALTALDPLFPDLVETPDAASVPAYAPVIAGWFWASRRLNPLADRDDLVAVTKAINGGTHGLKDREQWLVRAKGALLP